MDWEIASEIGSDILLLLSRMLFKTIRIFMVLGCIFEILEGVIRGFNEFGVHFSENKFVKFFYLVVFVVLFCCNIT